MTEPTDDLRQVMAQAICEGWGLDADVLRDVPTVLRAADAAIKAYERHRPPPTVVLTREEWAKARSIFVSGFWDESTESRVREAFPWLRVEGE